MDEEAAAEEREDDERFASCCLLGELSFVCGAVSTPAEGVGDFDIRRFVSGVVRNKLLCLRGA